jgi:hypothetical protein
MLMSVFALVTSGSGLHDNSGRTKFDEHFPAWQEVAASAQGVLAIGVCSAHVVFTCIEKYSI